MLKYLWKQTERSEKRDSVSFASLDIQKQKTREEKKIK